MRPLDLQSDSHLLPDTLPTSLFNIVVAVVCIKIQKKFLLLTYVGISFLLNIIRTKDI